MHCQFSGQAIAGDSKYGDAMFNQSMRGLGLKRLFLHANSLEFKHPISEDRVCVTSSLSDDLKKSSKSAKISIMNHKYKLLIFDWDGTLSDSVSRIALIQDAAVEHELKVPTFDEAANIIGLGLKEAISQLFPEADEELVAKMTSSYSDNYRIKDAGPSDFFPFVLETLNKLEV